MSHQGPPANKPTAQELIERNKSVAENHHPFPSAADMPQGSLPKTLIVSCVDPRCEPGYVFGLKPQEAILLRNIGGRISSVLKDVGLIDTFFALTQIIIVHHTDCGASLRPRAAVEDKLKEMFPHLETTVVKDLARPVISDFEQSIREDLGLLKDCQFVRKEVRESALGFVFDIKTGLLTPVA